MLVFLYIAKSHRIYGGGLVGWFLDFILYLMYAEASHHLILYFSQTFFFFFVITSLTKCYALVKLDLFNYNAGI